VESEAIEDVSEKGVGAESMTNNPHWLNHNTRKLDPEDVVLIRELRKEGLTLQTIANKFEVTKTHVSKIVNKKVWGHLA